jgi:hypothetical protein
MNNLKYMQNIPNWEARLSQKLLEKKAFIGLANVGKAALTGLGSGAKLGAGIGAGLGGLNALTSDDPNASVMGGALRGGLKGGMYGGALGGLGAGALRAAPGALSGMGSLAGRAGLPGASSALHSGALRSGGALGRFPSIAGQNVAMPGWAQSMGQRIGPMIGMGGGQG